MRRYSVLRSAIKHNVGTTSKIHSALQEAAELAAVGATAAIGRILCQQRAISAVQVATGNGCYTMIGWLHKLLADPQPPSSFRNMRDGEDGSEGTS